MKTIGEENTDKAPRQTKILDTPLKKRGLDKNGALALFLCAEAVFFYMFEQAFKNIDDTLHKDAGVSNELDYTEQTSWMLFLKYLEDQELKKKYDAEMQSKKYSPMFAAAYRWHSWAAPKNARGKFEHNKALTGDDLLRFVNEKLFPYLKNFKNKAGSSSTIEYKIGEIFSEIRNKIQSGYVLRDILEIVDELKFHSQKEKYEMSHLYEEKIKRMGNAGRNGGEYYTPRPLIRSIVKVLKPKIGERIYDGALGSAGFLCEAFDYLRKKPKLSTSNLKTLQEKTFYGKEKKSFRKVRPSYDSGFARRRFSGGGCKDSGFVF